MLVYRGPRIIIDKLYYYWSLNYYAVSGSTTNYLQLWPAYKINKIKSYNYIHFLNKHSIIQCIRDLY